MQSPDRAAAWEAEGRRLAPALDPTSAALVAGLDVEAAAHLALGIAAAQAGRRRVAVADLTGTAGPIVRLVPDDDPHGLADTFLYGVSLNRVARQIDAEGRLFVVPTGTEPALASGLADSHRWRRVADGFRDVGALLLLVAPSDAEGLMELAQRVDGVVAADHGSATQRLPRLLATAETPDAALPQAGTPRARTPLVAPIVPGRRMHPLLIGAIGVIVVVGLVWAATRVGRPRASERPLFADTEAADTTAPVVAPMDSGLGLIEDPADTVTATDSGAVTASPTAGPGPIAAADPAAPPPVANPEDLRNAAAWTIVYQSFPTEDAAERAYRTRPRSLAAPTIAPSEPDGGPYRVVSGGWSRRTVAASTLANLRTSGVVPDTTGRLVNLPYAVQLASSVPRESVVPTLNRFLARGIPAYAMRQASGRAHVYAGAFAEPMDARALLASLQAAGLPAALVVRIGSPL